ncbi:hypothetical protein M8C21_004043, partial [Ambrosia artemisiifolia]
MQLQLRVGLANLILRRSGLNWMGRILVSWAMKMIDLLVSDWWDEINESRTWQDAIFFTLAASYALVSSIALIQLIRIQLRVPEYGWTTQKVFHLMNFIVNGVRAIVFGFHLQVFNLHPKASMLFFYYFFKEFLENISLLYVCIWMLLEVPGLLFFSTYTLLVLFWAEIYHQAKNLPTGNLRIIYVSVNAGVYFIQGCLWLYLYLDDSSLVQFLGKIFVAVMSLLAAIGFLLYGGRLFIMLRRFPIESKGRQKKLHEVGSVTGICFTCFLVRCFV